MGQRLGDWPQSADGSSPLGRELRSVPSVDRLRSRQGAPWLGNFLGEPVVRFGLRETATGAEPGSTNWVVGPAAGRTTERELEVPYFRPHRSEFAS